MKSVHTGYNKLAPFYNFLLLLSGRYIIKSQRSLIPDIPDTHKALLVGEGTGNFLYKLIASKKIKNIFCLDISEKMMQICRNKNTEKHIANSSTKKIYFIVGDVDCLNPNINPKKNTDLNSVLHVNNADKKNDHERSKVKDDNKFSLITTNFFLDQFNEKELSTVMQKIDSLLQPRGLWYFTDFVSPDTFFQEKLLSVLYSFFRKLCNITANQTPDYSEQFINLGYKVKVDKKLRFGIRTTLYQKPLTPKPM